MDQSLFYYRTDNLLGVAYGPPGVRTVIIEHGLYTKGQARKTGALKLAAHIYVFDDIANKNIKFILIVFWYHRLHGGETPAGFRLRGVQAQVVVVQPLTLY